MARTESARAVGLRPPADVGYAWVFPNLNERTCPNMRATKTKLLVIAASGLLIVALVLALAAFVASQRAKRPADGGEGTPPREVSPADSALDTSGARSTAMALFSRANELARLGDNEGALAVFEQTVTEWEARPWTVPEEMRRRGRLFGKQLALLSLEDGATQHALRFLSAGTRASGRPFSALQEHQARLDAATRRALWPESPFILLTSFAAENAPLPVLFGAAQNAVFEVRRESAGEAHEPCAVVAVSSGEGRPCFGLQAMVDVSSGTLGLRARVKAEKPVPISMALRFWFPREKVDLIYLPTEVRMVDQTWTWLTVEGDFLKYCYDHALSAGYDMAGVCIDRVGIAVAGEPNTFWLDRLELYLPADEGNATEPESAAPVSVPGGANQ